MRLHTIALVLPFALFYASGQAQSGPRDRDTPASGAAADRAISLDLKKATLTDVVSLLGQKYGLSILSDAYSDDARLPGVQITDVPLNVALPKLAELYQRDVRVVHGIIMLRHHEWYRRTLQEKFSAEHYGVFWRTAGRVSIQRLDDPATAAIKPPSPNLAVVLGPKKEARPLPARLLSLEASDVPVKSVLAAFSAQSGWSAHVEPALASRRLSAQLHRVTPAQALEALTMLLNARQEVAIGQSEAQKQQEVEALDTRSEREKASDLLKEELAKSMSPEQREALKNGKSVEFGIQSLPPDLQQRATAYVGISLDQVRRIASGFPEPDMARISEFRLEIRPESFLGINVYGFDANGGRIGF